MRQRTILAMATAFCAVAVLMLVATVVSAAAPEAKPEPKASKARVTWTPSVVTSTAALAAAESVTATATFTATETITNARVVVHGGRGLVTVSPSTFPTVNPGQSYSVTITIKAPTKGHKGGVSAQLQLREGRRALSKPLHVRWRP